MKLSSIILAKEQNRKAYRIIIPINQDSLSAKMPLWTNPKKELPIQGGAKVSLQL